MSVTVVVLGSGELAQRAAAELGPSALILGPDELAGWGPGDAGSGQATVALVVLTVATGEEADVDAMIGALMAHPAFLGGWTVSDGHGIAADVLHGTLMRLAGADLSIFVSSGGRFGWPEARCRAIAAACTDPAGPGRPMLPAPGGGVSVARAAEMAATYGADAAFLLGGSLVGLGAGIPDALARMRATSGATSVASAAGPPVMPVTLT